MRENKYINDAVFKFVSSKLTFKSSFKLIHLHLNLYSQVYLGHKRGNLLLPTLISQTDYEYAFNNGQNSFLKVMLEYYVQDQNITNPGYVLRGSITKEQKDALMKVLQTVHGVEALQTKFFQTSMF